MSSLVSRGQEIDDEIQAQAGRHDLRSRDNKCTPSFTSLQFIDDCSSIVRGSPKGIDKALGKAAEEFKLKWDNQKDRKMELIWG